VGAALAAIIVPYLLYSAPPPGKPSPAWAHGQRSLRDCPRIRISHGAALERRQRSESGFAAGEEGLVECRRATSLIPSELDWPSGPIVPYSTRILGTRDGFAHALLALRANRTIAFACASIFAHTGDGSPVGTNPSSSCERKCARSLFLSPGRGAVYPLSGVFERRTFQDKRHMDVRATARAQATKQVWFRRRRRRAC